MKRSVCALFVAFAVAVLSDCRSALAEDIDFASHSEIRTVLDQQNQRIAELEASQHPGTGADCCDSSCGACDPCCRPSGVIGGAEISFLKFNESLGTSGADGTDLDPGYDPAYRVWAGFQGSDGLGWRIRYWEFDHTTFGASLVGGNTDTLSVDTYVIDLEFVDSMNLGCNWDASYFAGFRYMEFDHIRASFASGVLDQYSEFDNAAGGITLGGELRRCIGYGLAGFVNARGSVLLGDTSEYDELGFVDEKFNTINYLWEAQAGVQLTRELEVGGYLFARAAAEVQYWDNFVGESFFDVGEAVGFGGLSLSAGIIR